MADWAEREARLRELCGALGLDFRDINLLDRALTHASANAGEHPVAENYESLEFLGDAVLDLAVAEYLYGEHPDGTPGEYTQMRAVLVSGKSLASAAKRLNLPEYIRLGPGEIASGGRKRSALLADCFEAVIGAVFLDGGWERARAFVLKVFEEDIRALANRETALDYRSRLQQVCQARKWELPEFRVAAESGPDHAKIFEVEVYVQGEMWGRGRGKSKKDAEQRAACEALSKDATL